MISNPRGTSTNNRRVRPPGSSCIVGRELP